MAQFRDLRNDSAWTKSKGSTQRPPNARQDAFLPEPLSGHMIGRIVTYLGKPLSQTSKAISNFLKVSRSVLQGQVDQI